jgi:lipoate-protein ligase B
MRAFLHSRWLGTLEYGRAFRLQEDCCCLVRSSAGQDHLMLCLEHDPVYTLGKRGGAEFLHADEARLRALGATVVQSNRGGLITFHGPGQLVAYPLIELAPLGKTFAWYIERLLEASLKTCLELGVGGARIDEEHPGIWVEDRKLLSVGVRTTEGVTMHGIALNLSTPMSWFQLIDPCGLQVRMTSILLETGLAPTSPQAAWVLHRHLAAGLGLTPASFLDFS